MLDYHSGKFNKKVSFKRKILSNSILTITVMLIFIFCTYYYFFHYELKNRFKVRLTSLAKIAALMIDANDHDKLKTRVDENSKEYSRIKKTLQIIKKANPDIKYIYTMRKTDKKDIWAFVVDGSEGKDFSYIGDKYDVSSQQQMKQAYNGPIADNNFETDEWGTFLSGYAPIRNSSGQAVGIVGVDMDAKDLIALERKMFYMAAVIFLISMGLVTFTNIKGINIFLAQFNKIIDGINQIKKGDLDYRFDIKSNDEFGVITNALNSTADLLVDNQRLLEKELTVSKEEREKIFKVYSDVIYAVTQGKFNLLDYRQSIPIGKEGDLSGVVILDKPEDVDAARQLIKSCIKEETCSSPKEMQIKLCVSEAATNVIKHAKNGRVEVRKIDDKLRVVIIDYGPGMDLNKLPNMIFLEGYSTKISMGYGFSLISKFADKVYLSTSKSGTFFAMDFDNC